MYEKNPDVEEGHHGKETPPSPIEEELVDDVKFIIPK
jgi:hypothetical protein